jgi:hypothetical protein
LFLGITTQIKVEGLPFVFLIVLFIIANIVIKKLYGQLALMPLIVLIMLPWELVKHALNLGGVYVNAHPFAVSWGKTNTALWGTLKELINIKSWSMLWITYFLTFLFPQSKNKELFIIHIVVLSQLFLYILVYIFTSGNGPDSSIERLLVHIAPLAIYAVAVNIFNLKIADVLGKFSRKRKKILL